VALATGLLFAFLCTAPGVAQAQMQERLCDTQLEDCRAPLLNLIRNEQQGIDVAFWYMTDAWYSNEIIKRWQAGVPVRVLVDTRASVKYTVNAQRLQDLKNAGIPMRNKASGTNLHWKMMLFNGQNTVEFSKANYGPYAFGGERPGDDEAVYFSTDSALTNSFRTRYDDLWIDTTKFVNYANVTGALARKYPVYPTVSWMNFPPFHDFASRVLGRFNAEPTQIDALVFRITDDRYADALIAAKKRGVRVRVIADLDEYRDAKKLRHSYNLDRLYAAGVEMKQRNHAGLLHEMAVVLHGSGEAIFGSSNFSPNNQNEHNVFYSPSVNTVLTDGLGQGKTFFQWFADQFEGKWNNASGFGPFQPLAPTNPAYSAPTNFATGQSTTSVTLKWDGGNWAYLYDIYFGTSSTPPLLVQDIPLGSTTTGALESYTVQNLLPGTTYYWRIVGKTMAKKTNGGATWSFTTSGVGGGSTAYGGSPVLLPGTIQAVNFDEGGSGAAYYDTTAGNKGGVYRSTDVDIGPVAGGGYYVGWTRPGEWLTYTVNVGASGTYTLSVRVANMGTGATFRVEVDGTDRTGARSVPDTGGWDIWQTITVPGIELTAGQHVVRVVHLTGTTATGGVGNYRDFTFN
jgi:hypothetical protein